MSESLHALCDQFEQMLLAGMLRSAGFGKSGTAKSGATDIDTDGSSTSDAPPASDPNAFQELVVQALSGAIERAGGVGLARRLAAALESVQP
jgi:hypothetical protein